MVIVLIMYFSVDYYFWSRQYFYQNRSDWTVGKEQAQAFERLRASFFAAFPFRELGRLESDTTEAKRLIDFLQVDPRTTYRKIFLKVIRGAVGQQQIDFLVDDRQNIETYLTQQPLRLSVRILLLGTSQMWGEGATSKFDHIEARLQKILSTRFRNGPEIAIINASRRGSRASELLERYRSHLHLFDPDLVVINLSNNDAVKEFDRRLVSILEQNRNLGALSLFVLEAKSIESPENGLQEKHAMMIQVAEQHNIPWLDLYGHLTHADIYDTGILWWDRVHLTSYGQSVAAEFIAQGVLANFEFVNGRPGDVIRRSIGN